jgi:glycosyltransferase involved in cell wall biosynthesis
MTVPELSIVIPCYNEIENIRGIVTAVTREAVLHAASHEIILIDNHSTDGTREAIADLCRADGRVRAILNNRNYGQMRSPTHGIYQARGAAVIGMCADFQDPPAMIGQFLALWRGGAKVVLAQRRSENASPLLSLARRLGYAALGGLADYPLVPGATGFGLFDRAVVDTLKTWREPEPFFRGMVVESGFPLALVPFDRPGRAAGETKNGIGSLVSFALSGLAGSAKSLLRLPILLSLWAGLAAILLGLAGVIAAVADGPAALLAALAVMCAMFATLLLFLGLIGDQVRLITERTRNVPLVIEEARLNFPKAP